MKCNTNEMLSSVFIVNYNKGSVKFKNKIFSKKKMDIREFAIVVLGIHPISTEVIAMYIGKMGFETYNKGLYEISIIKKTRTGIKGIVKVNKKSG